MRCSRFSEEQIIAIPKESEGDAKVYGLCRRREISSATFYG